MEESIYKYPLLLSQEVNRKNNLKYIQNFVEKSYKLAIFAFKIHFY